MENSLKMMAVGMLMACLLPLTALAQQQEWQSTSTMQGSGSAYSSQVTAVGTTSVGSMATTTSSGPARVSRPRRAGESSSDPWGNNQTGGDQDEGSPVGDALIPLMLFACAYLIIRAMRRKNIEKA